ncbi:MAG: ATP-dependent RecD-like DNA helicase [Lachnospiraceae bacterium]|nr:ATP-dependent RecD-like DNA helicase [Lachnospiraceae bacterium]
MEIFEGTVEHIIYRNVENGYTVFRTVYQGDAVTCTGIFSDIEEGMEFEFSGYLKENTKYGEQIEISSYKELEIKTAGKMERYLGSGAIKGVKAALAKKIVARFGDDTFKILENEPERLAEIKGISEKRAIEIGKIFYEKRAMREALVFLGQYNISNAFGVKIFEMYGDRMYTILKENPYRLIKDIPGIGFKKADDIAMQMGFSEDGEERLKAILLYTMQQSLQSGHCYLPEKELLNEVTNTSGVDWVLCEHALEELLLDRTFKRSEDDSERIYLSKLYYLELNIGKMLADLNGSFDISESKLEAALQRVETDSKIVLDEKQRIAIKEALNNGVFILTGGPGTGKTTTIRTILDVFEREGLDILLAAPTGRAAKRMTEATGREAQTIHRLLEFSGQPSENVDNRAFFNRNLENPLEADAIIIDETSMVDIFLFDALLKAVTPTTRLILVGDTNQLPSVGPGNVLKDVIASGEFHIVELDRIFRQSEESNIIVNAHKIKNGEDILISNKESKDFFVLQRSDSAQVRKEILSMAGVRLCNYLGIKPLDIQILSPMKKGEIGVEALNVMLQEQLNPPIKGKLEHKTSDGVIFREGDKVMQIQNNYETEWKIMGSNGYVKENGTGIFNGDVGIVDEINPYSESVRVIFDDGKIVEYPFQGLDELTLAYAVTIHKSQGSEYPAVIIPLLGGGSNLLFNRNVLYTGVTRAKRCVVIIGETNLISRMIHNVNEQKRYTGLSESVKAMCDRKKRIWG